MGVQATRPVRNRQISNRRSNMGPPDPASTIACALSWRKVALQTRVTPPGPIKVASAAPNEKSRAKARLSGLAAKGQDYLILPSLYSTCLRATGSYFLMTIFSVMVRAFFLVT